jgi:hypothetical protein
VWAEADANATRPLGARPVLIDPDRPWTSGTDGWAAEWAAWEGNDGMGGI